MPIQLLETPLSQPPLVPPRKRWTRTECEALESSGLLDQESVELVEGELISKMPKKRPHVNTLTLLRNWLIQVFGANVVNTECPIDVAPEDNPTNEPEPDAIVLNKPTTAFQRNPRPDELCLVVEIADTSLTYDLSTKAALYARAGIIDYWVVDISNRRMIVHRQPQAGQYKSVVVYTEGERVAPLAAPDREFSIASAFPL